MIFLIFFGIVVIAGQPYWPRFICLYYFLKFFRHRRHCRSALLARVRFVMIFLIFSASASLLYWPGFICYDFFDFFGIGVVPGHVTTCILNLQAITTQIYILNLADIM